MRKVKAGALGIDQAALLLHMRAQHFAQGLVHQVRGRVIAHRGSAQRRVDLCIDRVSHRQGTLCERAVMTKHIGFDFQRVLHLKVSRTAYQRAFVAHLTTAFGIKRRALEHNHATLSVLELGHRLPIHIKRDHFGGLAQALVADKFVACAGILQRFVHLEFASGTGL